jgi:hypothetical protein
MKHKHILFRLAMGIVIGVMTASAKDETTSMRAEIIDYGLYSRPTASSTRTGSDGYQIAVSTNLILVAQTNIVHAKMGDYVGFRYQLYVTNGPPPRILVCVTRPPKPVLDPTLPDPMEPVYKLMDYPLTSHLGFCFEKEWECVSGEWLFQIRTETELLAEKKIIILFDKEKSSNHQPRHYSESLVRPPQG